MADITISHYSTGTATVAANGTNVVGQGTAWVGAVRPGDLFGTHRGLSIRILSVNSNTSLTLARAWPGPAQTAAAYEIQRTPYDLGYRQAIEDLVAGISEGNLPMLAALAGAANKLPYFDSANSMATADFPAWARSMLSQPGAADKIPYLTGANGAALTPLTGFARERMADLDATAARDALEVNWPIFFNTGSIRTLDRQGWYYAGVGSTDLPPGENEGWLSVYYFDDLSAYKAFEFIGTTSSARWHQSQTGGVWGPWRSSRDASNLTEGLLNPARLGVIPEGNIPYLTTDKAYRRNNIVGSVSQSGGVPTGSLVERAVTASGYYERYAGGLQICIVPYVIYLDTALFQVVSLPAGFASIHQFSSALSASTSVVSGDANTWYDNVDGISVYNNGPASVGLLFRRPPVGVAGTVYVTSIGRWF